MVYVLVMPGYAGTWLSWIIYHGLSQASVYEVCKQANNSIFDEVDQAEHDQLVPDW